MSADKESKLEKEKAKVLSRMAEELEGEEVDEEWEALDKAAEIEEQKVFEEVAAAKVERAKIEARHLERERQLNEAAAKELERERKAEKAALPEEDLTEEERLLRRAQVAARDGVQLRRTAKMSIFFTALGLVDVLVGVLRQNLFVIGVGVVLFVFCFAYYMKVRPRLKAAVEHFDILNAELEEYRAKNPKPKQAEGQTVTA